MDKTKKEIILLNRLIKSFGNNLEELKELLKLPGKFEKQAKAAKKKLDEIFLPILISKVENDLKKTPKNVKKEGIQKMLNHLIDEYRKIAPKNVSKKGKLLITVDEQFFKNLSSKQLEKEREKFQHCISHQTHIEKAVLFNLIAYLEQLFSEISHIILKKYPEILSLKEKNLTFDEIKKFTDLEEAKEYLISQEVEKLLFRSIQDFFDFFEEKMFKTKFPSLSIFKNNIIETKERRNLLMHNGGIINTKYINSIDKSLIEKYKIKKDEKITLDKPYLEEAINKFQLLGLEILSLACLKFQENEDREEAGWNIISKIYDTFAKKNENLFLGENLSRFLLSQECKKYLTEKQKDYCTLNYWHILKKQKKLEVFKNETEQYDTSSKNHVIQLCYYSLIENYDRAHQHLKPSLQEEDFNLEMYKDFPILEGLRKQKDAQKIVEEFRNNK